MSQLNISPELLKKLQQKAADRGVSVEQFLESCLDERHTAASSAEERFRIVSELSTDYAFSMRVNPDGTINLEWVTDSYKDITGYDPDELNHEHGPGWSRLVHPDDRAVARNVLKRLIETPQTLQGTYRIITSRGNIRHVQSSTRSIADESGRVAQIIGTVKDITREQQAIAALRESEARYQNLYINAPVAYVTADPTGVIQSASDQTRPIFGCAPDDLIGKHVFELYSPGPDGIEKARKLFEHTRAGGEISSEEVLMQRMDGTPIWIELNLTTIYDRNGRVISRNAIMLDISERKQSEEALLQNQRLLESIFRAVPNYIYIFDLEAYRVTFASQGLENVLGYQPNEFYEPGSQIMQKLIHPDDMPVLEQNALRIQQAEDHASPQYVEYRIKHKDGTWRRIRDGAVPFQRNEAGEVTHIVGVMVDITELLESRDQLEARVEARTRELQKLNAKLRRSEDDLREILDKIPVAIIINGLANDYQFRNQASVALLGIPPDDTHYQPVDFYANPAERDEIMQEIQAKGGISGREVELRRLDGTTRWVMGWAYPAELNGEPVLLGILMDITHRREIEEALRKSEERHRVISSLISDFAYSYRVTDSGLELDWATESFQDIMGYTPEEVSAQGGWQHIIHEDDIPKSLAEMHWLLTGPYSSTQEYRMLHKDGSIRHVQIHSQSVQNEQGRTIRIDGAVQDITAHVKAEKALRESESRLRLLAENSGDIICLHNPQGDYIYVSPSSEKITGYKPGELLGRNAYELFHPEDIEHIREESHEKALAGEEIGTITYRYRTKSGEYIWLETYTRPVMNAAGNIQHLVTSSRDVTERRNTREALRRERDLLQQVMNTSPVAILLLNRKGEVTFANHQAETLLDKTLAEMQQRSYKDTSRYTVTDLEGNPFSMEKRPFIQIINTGEPVYGVQQKLTWPDTGRQIIVSVSGAPLFNAAGEIEQVVFLMEDITLRKRWEREVQKTIEHQQELLQLKARFLSMVSHEFRTPLAAMLVSSSMLRDYYDRMDADKRRHYLEKIESHIQHLTRMMEEVSLINKADSIGLEPRIKEVDLATFAADCIEEVEQALARPDSITLDYKACLQIKSDEHLLHHILANLLSNAVKYSPDSQSVTLSIRCVQAEQHLYITVKDTGIGIPREDQQNLFESFHRAENVGDIHGSGLGLAIVKQAVDALKGEITFESALNSGTTFHVKIPVISLDKKT